MSFRSAGRPVTAPSPRCLAAVVLVGLALGRPGLGVAQGPSPDQVEDLRLVLRRSFDAPRDRHAAVTEQLARLGSVEQLRAAIALPDWQVDEHDAMAAVDLAARTSAEARVLSVVRSFAARDDTESKLLAVRLLAEVGRASLSLPRRQFLRAGITTDLLGLIERGPAAVAEPAARALGEVDPDPGPAAACLGRLLTGPSGPQRVIAAEALVRLLQVGLRSPLSRTPEGEKTSPRAVSGFTGAVVPVAVLGLGDARPEVRRPCVAALALAALTAHDLMKKRGDEAGPAAEQILAAFRGHGPAVIAALRDPDPEVRRRARGCLENLANAARSGDGPQTGRWGRVAAGIVRDSLPTLTADLGDPDPRVVRATLDVLEASGPAVRPFAPQVAALLQGRDGFVRWSAARILGKLGPDAAAAAGPALARLLDENDPDIRHAAAVALAAFGPTAEPAVPKLVALLGSGDADARLDALHVLAAMGPAASPALPALRDRARDPDCRVRQGTARLLGTLGPMARSNISDLQRLLDDPDADVRASALSALAGVTAPPGAGGHPGPGRVDWRATNR